MEIRIQRLCLTQETLPMKSNRILQQIQPVEFFFVPSFECQIPRCREGEDRRLVVFTELINLPLSFFPHSFDYGGYKEQGFAWYWPCSSQWARIQTRTQARPLVNSRFTLCFLYCFCFLICFCLCVVNLSIFNRCVWWV